MACLDFEQGRGKAGRVRAEVARASTPAAGEASWGDAGDPGLCLRGALSCLEGLCSSGDRQLGSMTPVRQTEKPLIRRGQ